MNPEGPYRKRTDAEQAVYEKVKAAYYRMSHVAQCGVTVEEHVGRPLEVAVCVSKQGHTVTIMYNIEGLAEDPHVDMRIKSDLCNLIYTLFDRIL